MKLREEVDTVIMFSGNAELFHNDDKEMEKRVCLTVMIKWNFVKVRTLEKNSEWNYEHEDDNDDDDGEQVREGRLSFPSGHASLACFGATFAILYIQVLLSFKNHQSKHSHPTVCMAETKSILARCDLSGSLIFLEPRYSCCLSSMPPSVVSPGGSSS